MAVWDRNGNELQKNNGGKCTEKDKMQDKDAEKRPKLKPDKTVNQPEPWRDR